MAVYESVKRIYENYYVQGGSEGASSGKAFEDKNKGGNGYEFKHKKFGEFTVLESDLKIIERRI